jgi:radical SAM superfamily enzyme YgiQ (UPF0313 family)
MKKVHLLLINPKSPDTFWSFRWVSEQILPQKLSSGPPLGLASVAALTPEHWKITILDENIEPLDLSIQADIVGVGGMSNQFPRQTEILKLFRQRGAYVVAGGSHASLLPGEYQGVAHTVVAGEAEYTWPQFCKDFEDGTPSAHYQETGDVDMHDVPCPRFDLLKLDLYTVANVQFSRGCPFRCEFCDIIVMFGRRPRTKTLSQIEVELDALRRAGVRNVFFVDDNFIGHKPKAKELLQGLADYQSRHRYRFYFGSEASMNLASDHELLQLFREANFGWLFIGIESPSQAALVETKKLQNRGDLLAQVRTIHGYGIGIQAGFILGFDSDDRTIFRQQLEFIQSSGIIMAMAGLLHAIPRTPLWERLKKEGRLRLETLTSADNTGSSTNFEPMRMSYQELVDGYTELMLELYSDRAIHARICQKLTDLKRPITAFSVPLQHLPGLLWRFYTRAILAGGPQRIYYFLDCVRKAGLNYSRLEVVVDSWINALSIQHFAKRRFTVKDTSPSSLGFLRQNS